MPFISKKMHGKGFVILTQISVSDILFLSLMSDSGS